MERCSSKWERERDFLQENPATVKLFFHFANESMNDEIKHAQRRRAFKGNINERYNKQNAAEHSESAKLGLG